MKILGWLSKKNWNLSCVEVASPDTYMKSYKFLNMLSLQEKIETGLTKMNKKIKSSVKEEHSAPYPTIIHKRKLLSAKHVTLLHDLHSI